MRAMFGRAERTVVTKNRYAPLDTRFVNPNDGACMTTLAPSALLTWRRSAGLSQREAAAKLGISKSRYCEIEGGAVVGFKRALKICEATGLTLAALDPNLKDMAERAAAHAGG
jgi:DNA-binding XRE family transcriptional regulator